MDGDERWILLASVMPDGIDVEPDEDGAIIKDDSGNEVKVIYNDADNSYNINGRTIHFENTNDGFINTIMVPYILQELDGERRI